MADELPLQSLETQTDEEEEEEEEGIEEEEELEVELKQMAQLIQQYRSTVPDRIRNTFSSLMAAQRPLLLSPGLITDQNPESTVDENNAESSEGRQLADEDPEIADKIHLLKHKISSHVSALPSQLKRVNDCISMFDKLDTYNVSIHPAFKRKKT